MLKFDVEVLSTQENDGSHGHLAIAVSNDLYEQLTNPASVEEFKDISRYFSSADADERFGMVLNWLWENIYKDHGIEDFPGWLDCGQVSDSCSVDAVAENLEELKNAVAMLMSDACCVGSGLWE